MPYYDFYCKGCKILIEDEFFKIADEKNLKCDECDEQMEQVILKAPGLRDPGGIGQKWTNDGYQMVDHKGVKRTVTEKWERGKNKIRLDCHTSDPDPNEAVKRNHERQVKTETKTAKELGVSVKKSKPLGLFKYDK